MDKFCRECGTMLEPVTKICPACGYSPYGEVNQVEEDDQSSGSQIGSPEAVTVQSAKEKPENMGMAVSGEAKRNDEKNSQHNARMSYESAEYRDFAKGLLLTVITLGVYAIYWQYKFVKDLKKIAGKECIRGYISALLLTVVTMGIYMVYYQYKMGQAVNKAQDQRHMLGERYTFGRLVAISIVAPLVLSFANMDEMATVTSSIISAYYYYVMIKEYNKVIAFDND